MSIKDLIHSTFPSASTEDWEKTAQETLKDKPLRSLTSNTSENILLKPLYSKEDAEVSGQSFSDYPGKPDYRRGIHCLGYHSESWKVAQKISYEHSDEWAEKLVSSFEKGQTAISFEIKTGLFTDSLQLMNVLAELATKHPFSIHAKGVQEILLGQLISAIKDQGGKEKVKGYIAADPVSTLAAAGDLPMSVEDTYDKWAETIRLAGTELPNLRTILVDVAPYHNGGANAVQDLAIAVAAGVFHIQELLKRGLDLENVLSKIVFHFPIGANFFMEAAKIRAARLLWDKVSEAFGAHPEVRKMIISAETSSFTKTIFDPYVNLLRAGNEAFAAVVGGVQYFHVEPFDMAGGRTSAFSERIARNTQLILREEAHLARVADPAGGSWFIESLTRELAEQAWELFLEIDRRGGIVDVLKTGWLQKEISAVFEKRKDDIFTRKQSIIGTNVYVNLGEEKMKSGQKPEDLFFYNEMTLSESIQWAQAGKSFHSKIKTDGASSGESVKPLRQNRLAEPYEELRQKAHSLENPRIGLICLGSLKKHKPRADFIAGFMAAGGIGTEKSPDIESVDAAVAFVQETKSRFFCLCGDEEQYREVGPEIARAISAKFPGIQLYLAGLPGDGAAENWMKAGISEFIHSRSNCYEILSSLLKEMEADKNDR